MSRRGLPSGMSMRHDSHYVEELGAPATTPVGRMIATELLDPNPLQPRVEIGDLTDLISSIAEQGVLEPLLVKPLRDIGRWLIIAGERRWRAASAVGLKEVPCIELDVDEKSIAEIALVENLQRKDLTIWEEADGLAALSNRFGYTHEEVARKVGKSRSSITELLSIAGLPEDVRGMCKRAELTSKSLLLELVRMPDEDSMKHLLESTPKGGLTRERARELRKAVIDPVGLRPPKPETTVEYLPVSTAPEVLDQTGRRGSEPSVPVVSAAAPDARPDAILPPQSSEDQSSPSLKLPQSVTADDAKADETANVSAPVGKVVAQPGVGPVSFNYVDPTGRFKLTIYLARGFGRDAVAALLREAASALEN